MSVPRIARRLPSLLRATLALSFSLLLAGAAAAQNNTSWTFASGNATTTAKVGVGTNSPESLLHLNSADYSAITVQTTSNTGYAYARLKIPSGSSVDTVTANLAFMQGAGNYTSGNRFWLVGLNPVQDSFQVFSGVDGTSARPLLVIKPSGNIGINNASPTSTLDVTGDIHASGTISGYNVIAQYQDLAEWVPATESMKPGTVVVLNRDRDNEVMPSTTAYDSSVAGVVSERPGVLLGVAGASKAQIATTGRVKVHVDATKHPIKIGDLLVTGEKPGTAIASQPLEISGRKFHQPGTVIGKALQSLPVGEGEILVLLSLQ